VTKAFVDTTVLTDALLKPGPIARNAKNALGRYSETILPVFAIKEFKGGPLNYEIWLHNKLVSTQSLAKTFMAIAALVGHQPNRARTSLESLAGILAGKPVSLVRDSGSDRDLADVYRLALAKLIIQAWRKRRRITSSVQIELTCFAETSPVIEPHTRMFSNRPTVCRLLGAECCLAEGYRARTDDLRSILSAVGSGDRREDVRRRQVLHKLINTPKRTFDDRDCRGMGDAFFAFHSPEDFVILTTNVKDHGPLAGSLGKAVERA
jgi:hypothetical protein